MVERWLKQLIFTVLLLMGGLFAFVSPQGEYDYTSTPLLPEVEALLKTPEVTETMLENNIYPALVGIHAPSDTDFIEVGKQIVLDVTSTIKKSYETHDMDLLEHIGNLNKYYSDANALKTIRKIEGLSAIR